jgi:phosphate transport system substrate-binding protein
MKTKKGVTVSSIRLRPLVLVGILALFAAMPAAAAAKKKPTITISGSTSVAPLTAKLIPAYLRKCKHCANFKLAQGGSNVGVADVGAGRVTIGESSRDPGQPGDPAGLVWTKIARDAVCMITNNANQQGNLSQAQIKGIYTGPTFTNWGQVSDVGFTGSISPFGRATTSGTHDAFSKIFLGGAPQGNYVTAEGSNGLVQQDVKNTPTGIGYVSLAFTGGVHVVPYNGVACNLRNAKSGQYGGVRNFWMITRGSPTKPVKKFLKFVKSSKGQAIVATDWVPII